ncbi:enoyl-CoA hydratase/isomerase family protein [Pseudooceanicola sp. 216_PA32_1]|uniref:Enoyl-CoA hydratase/isomerase family protein n=1 Tax=Pseudooceanicola pacificus TaxID=2676438 RepID=A0A844WCK1_9RHOB|nr:enoyl-CoA hydratase-related protein [Pseudooceanicola pacificus]MWB78748.1 enoyl-CoA hydratase/isomerase family protein [Pseudooceanicola pacificus]
MPSDCLSLTTRGGGIHVIRMMQPERRNALSDPMRAALRDALRAAHADNQVRSIVLTGSGGCFCAGGDIKGMGQPVPVALERLEVLHDIIRLIAQGPKPVVASVDGAAYGGGLSLAICCDSVVAARDARFCASFGRVGLVPDMGCMWSLPRRIGIARAQRLMQTGREIRGPEAVEIGLADVLAEGDLLDAALAEAAALVPSAPLPAAHLRPTIARHHGNLDAVLAEEREAQAALFATRDHDEARRAFLEKREPMFNGT